MPSKLKIKDLAVRSGFSAPTLRYYEEIGLLPAAERTPAGYRTYDEGIVERLAFIARAKQLGCSLEEIADLTTAWDGGRCGPIQDRLRALVADKLATAQAQIVELTRLTGELRRSARALEMHRPDGPCDERCGCVTEAAPPAATGVQLIAKPQAAAELPIACTLGADAMRGQLEEWAVVLSHASRRTRVDDGIRVELDGSTPLDDLMRLVAAEQSCCQFLSFSITVDGRGVALEVRGPHDAQAIIAAVFGAPA